MTLHKTVKQRNTELAESEKQLKNYGVVLRIYPTDEQQILIAKTIGCVRRTFNAYLQARQDHYHEYGNVLSVSAYKKTVLNPSKKTDELSFLREVDKFALEEIVNIVQPVSINTIEADRIVGIDLGLKTFAVISNGDDTEYVDKVNYIKASEKKLAKLQRRLSKKSKHSSNFYKASAKVAKLQEHIANQRKDFAHKLSTRIADENQVVILEDLNIKGMVKNKQLAKAISDAGWQQFRTFLKYKLEWQGKHLIIIDRWYASSKTCSVCNEKNTALALSDREWVCGTCGAVHERDENAAINIRNEGVRVLMTVAV